MEEKLLFIEQTNGYEVISEESGEIVYWLRFYPDKELLMHKWIGYLTDEALKAIWLYTLDFVEKYDAFRYKSIADTSTLEGSFDGINDFILEVVLPRALAGGLKYSAYILPKDFYALLATQFYQEETKEMPFVTQYFDNQEEAEKWLMSL
ncbi:MAG: hypothetical protein MUE81_01410 [Thermoflexibacter sp.]|jgi:hypothetical protein|nr:hypothetical protein [Thermoflexibacter sp.]